MINSLLKIRILAPALANLIGLLVVLILGLTIWTEVHRTLRSFGPDTAVFLSLFVAIGFPVFYLVARHSKKLLYQYKPLASHFYSTVTLYVVASIALASIANSREQLALEGADITIRVILLLAFLGIGVNAMYIFQREADV